MEMIHSFNNSYSSSDEENSSNSDIFLVSYYPELNRLAMVTLDTSLAIFCDEVKALNLYLTWYLFLVFTNYL